MSKMNPDNFCHARINALEVYARLHEIVFAESTDGKPDPDKLLADIKNWRSDVYNLIVADTGRPPSSIMCAMLKGHDDHDDDPTI
jgi:hypothetical protein